MGATTQRTMDDRLGGVSRFVRALNRTPEEFELDHLSKLTSLTWDVAKVLETAIAGLRESGHTDKQIGEALGITQQAVSKRWPGGGRYIGAAGRYRKTTA
jgi:hypothetical protein